MAELIPHHFPYSVAKCESGGGLIRTITYSSATGGFVSYVLIKMEVILNRDVDKLGKAGVAVKVRDGFARNFLIPNGLAIPLTPANLKKLEQEKQRKALQLDKIKKDSEGLKERLASLSLTMPVLTQEEDSLYASITSQDIARSLKEEGFVIDKNSIILDEPIKSLGIYEVPIRLHPEVMAKVKVWIVKK
jgi:large subunit ribosomal protein L9